MQASWGVKTNIGVVALIAASLLLLFGWVGAGTADAKKGKVVACAAKKGENKGLLRLSKKGKCKKSEKKVVFSKKGPKGETGAAGPAGPAGPQGATGGPSQELITTVETLENQVTALCAYVPLVPGYTGVLDPLLDALDALLLGTPPPLPVALPDFSCP